MKLLVCLSCKEIFYVNQHKIDMCSCANVSGILRTERNKMLVFVYEKENARVIGISNCFIYHNKEYTDFSGIEKYTLFDRHRSHIVRLKIDSKEAKECGVRVASSMKELREQLFKNIVNEEINGL